MSGFPPITSHQQAMDLAEDLAWQGREWWNHPDRFLDDPRDLASAAVIYFARYTKALEQAIDELKAIVAVLAERAGVEVVNDPRTAWGPVIWPTAGRQRSGRDRRPATSRTWRRSTGRSRSGSPKWHVPPPRIRSHRRTPSTPNRGNRSHSTTTLSDVSHDRPRARNCVCHTKHLGSHHDFSHRQRVPGVLQPYASSIRRHAG